MKDYGVVPHSVDKLEEDMALLKLISLGKNDMKTGRVVSSTSFKDALSQRKQSLK